MIVFRCVRAKISKGGGVFRNKREQEDERERRKEILCLLCTESSVGEFGELDDDSNWEACAAHIFSSA